VTEVLFALIFFVAGLTAAAIALGALVLWVCWQVFSDR
jgi:hypothetical protein